MCRDKNLKCESVLGGQTLFSEVDRVEVLDEKSKKMPLDLLSVTLKATLQFGSVPCDVLQTSC